MMLDARSYNKTTTGPALRQLFLRLPAEQGGRTNRLLLLLCAGLACNRKKYLQVNKI